MRPLLATIALVLLAAVAHAVSPRVAELGSVEFPTSARNADAQAHFLRGVLYLHSFTFEAAEAEFRAAADLEPDFAMAYWGEALSHNHPLIAERDAGLPRAVLARLGPTPEARLAAARTERERGFLEAVEILFGEGSEEERVLAYAEAMRRHAERFPDDDEVQAFYAVSLLGTVRIDGDPEFRRRMRAGAIAADIFREHPNHPGAAHYVIHSFDDPVHAPLALSAAHRYALIAPDSAHALHMPSHIFIQHGMWEEVVRSNRASYDSAWRLWQTRDALTDTQRYYNDIYVWHALDWGQYGSLQLGDVAEARRVIELLKPVAEKSQASMAQHGPAQMQARVIVEAELWDEAAALSLDAASPDTLFAAGLGAARSGDLPRARRAAKALRSVYETRVASAGEGKTRPLAIQTLELDAALAHAEGEPDRALATLREALAIAEAMEAPRGAPRPIKPPFELLAEILLEEGRVADARVEFDRSLERRPNRTLSLRGAGRAAERDGDAVAAREHYGALLANLDTQRAHPGYREAKTFLDSQAGTPVAQRAPH